jgi:hypothetical protein
MSLEKKLPQAGKINAPRQPLDITAYEAIFNRYEGSGASDGCQIRKIFHEVV